MPELGTSGSVGGPGWAITQAYPSSLGRLMGQWLPIGRLMSRS
jgi:hypothetical protein